MRFALFVAGKMMGKTIMTSTKSAEGLTAYLAWPPPARTLVRVERRTHNLRRGYVGRLKMKCKANRNGRSQMQR
jgi:hypothetical protein